MLIIRNMGKETNESLNKILQNTIGYVKSIGLSLMHRPYYRTYEIV